jgi:hypothetical protein
MMFKQNIEIAFRKTILAGRLISAKNLVKRTPELLRDAVASPATLIGLGGAH